MKPPKDTHLWYEVLKGIKPLKHRPPSQEVSDHPVDSIHINKKRMQEYFDKHTQFLHSELLSSPPAKLLRKVGKIAIEAHIDLHGFTRTQAQHKLQKFIAMAHYDHLKWVLVVTGKGNPHNQNTLKNLVPQWLDEISLVTGYCAAKDNHGGAGAYYVRLKTV